MSGTGRGVAILARVLRLRDPAWGNRHGEVCLGKSRPRMSRREMEMDGFRGFFGGSSGGRGKPFARAKTPGLAATKTGPAHGWGPWTVCRAAGRGYRPASCRVRQPEQAMAWPISVIG